MVKFIIMFILSASNSFKKTYKKFVNKNPILERKISAVLEKLSNNPQNPSLSSHKVTVSNFGEVWSSKITADIRLIWEYNAENEIEILLLTIGGHDKVYR